MNTNQMLKLEWEEIASECLGSDRMIDSKPHRIGDDTVYVPLNQEIGYLRAKVMADAFDKRAWAQTVSECESHWNTVSMYAKPHKDLRDQTSHEVQRAYRQMVRANARVTAL